MYICLDCLLPAYYYVCPYCKEWWTFDVECYCEYQDDEGFDEGFSHLECLFDNNFLYCHEVLQFDDDFDYDDVDEGIYL